MTVRVAINGSAGSAGPSPAPALDRPGVQVVAVNDLVEPGLLRAPVPLRLRARPAGRARHGHRRQHRGGRRTIACLREKDPGRLPWGSWTWTSWSSPRCLHRRHQGRRAHHRGCPPVLIAAPATNEDLTVVLGVNAEA